MYLPRLHSMPIRGVCLWGGQCYFLPHASFHIVSPTLLGVTGFHMPSSELVVTTLPLPILPENHVNESPRWRPCAQSYSDCALLDRCEVSAKICSVVWSHNSHNFTRSPMRRTVSGSKYTVVPPSSSVPTFTHSAYAGSLLSTRSVIKASGSVRNGLM
jgi:hypothetical protein